MLRMESYKWYKIKIEIINRINEKQSHLSYCIFQYNYGILYIVS